MAATKVVFWGETAKVVLGMMSKGKSTLNRFRHGPAAAVVALTVAPWAPTLSGVVFASQPASFVGEERRDEERPEIVGEGALDTSSPTMEPAAESAAMEHTADSAAVEPVTETPAVVPGQDAPKTAAWLGKLNAIANGRQNKLLVGQLLLYHQMMKNLLKVRRYQD